MSKIIKKNGYSLPTKNEWYKAAYYDPTLNNGSGGYWNYATKNNTAPTPVSATITGDGSAGNSGNFANYNSVAVWNNAPEGNVTTVGTNGGSSYYGTFDQNGNVYEFVHANNSIKQIGQYWNSTEISKSWLAVSDLTLNNSATGFRIVTEDNLLDLSNFVSVGNINNQSDSTSFGSVSYPYQIAKYEVTVAEYVEFLNAIASTDTYGLYDTNMNSIRGGVERNGTPGNYTYTIKSNWINKPITFINPLRAARYCNWLTNGKPSGAQNSNTTERGIYILNGIIAGESLTQQKCKIRTNLSTNTANYNQPVGSTLGLTSVGTNGGPSYYGTYDQFGLAAQWTSTVANTLPNNSFPNNWVLLFSGSVTAPTVSYFDNIIYFPGTTNIFREARMKNNMLYGERSGMSARICSNTNANNIPDMVLVSDINNTSDNQLRNPFPTSINYIYYIGRYLITVKNYLDFLNAIASTDIYQCYNDCISGAQNNPLIIRNGSVGSYTYSTDLNNYNLPFNLKYSNLARYCNWLHNNKPIGNQDNSTTENGSYSLNNLYSDSAYYYVYPSTLPVGDIENMPLPTRQPNAKYWIPTAGEWYKAACYDPTLNNGSGGYWSIPTKSNTLPRRITNKKNNNDGILYKFSVRS